ncbi:U11/U12 small nuclear ribonucleoprotein 48 kDa protein-like [Ruditapes philippinarum]|uniref:U11/U12 small nuclear ribonucleoprotein 48 kDa protein-like n=1 Tax=Ruditapes philippinarum TaxID=129788 RepID=UPI00295B4F84|nr:U11/U12 small nuclear ribonucleoprotein 48 kDa protein-like [Ruditapes philippinarum]
MSTAETSSISNKEIADRQKCLDSLGEFIDKCQEDITSMLDSLGWTPEHFMQPRNLCECPHNSDHRMPKSSVEKHSHLCKIVSQGYSKEDAEKIAQDRSFFYKDAACVHPVKLDLDTLNSVLWNHHVQNHSVFYGYKKVPQTGEEEQVLMSREDRLGIAEYVIKRAKEANRLKELGQDELLVSENLADLIKKDNEERKLDPFEEMAALRDYRRRRQTYRAKNVHITKKSHTEITREVINNQMEMYTQSLKDEMGHSQMLDDQAETDSRRIKTEDSTGEKDRDDRSRHRDSRRYDRSRSRSRDRSYRSSRRSRSRSRDRSSKYSRVEKEDRLQDSRRRSRSRSRESGKSKYKRKNRSRSRSNSSERSKKPKHKKHKHKHKKHKKSDRKSEDKESADKGDNSEKTLEEK